MNDTIRDVVVARTDDRRLDELEVLPLSHLLLRVFLEAFVERAQNLLRLDQTHLNEVALLLVQTLHVLRPKQESSCTVCNRCD